MNESGLAGYNPHRWCIVPECKNSSVTTPEKLWIRVPTDLDMRRKWLSLASRDPKMLLVSKSDVYFCEDHFDLENDMENCKQHKTLGKAKNIHIKPNCIPTRFDCQNRETSAPSELNESQFDVITPNNQSVASLEQSKISNLLSPMDTEDCGLNEDTETAQIPTLFCICCLEKDVPMVSLLTCSHADFLNTMMLPEIKAQNQVICYGCHEKLKEIKLFKLQVEDSFKLLLDRTTEFTPKCSNKRHNFKIIQAFTIDIPQTNNIDNPQTILEDAKTNTDVIIKKEIKDDTEMSTPPNSSENKKIKNIKEAMRIINSNQKSDCINYLATALHSLSNTLLSDICTNFDLGIQNDTKPTEMKTNVDTAPANNIATATTVENITNNLLTNNPNAIENSEIIKEKIDTEKIEKSEVVENVGNEELNQPVIENDSIYFDGSNNMQIDETLASDNLALGTRPSLGSHIKQLTLTGEQLMEDRHKIATSQSYLRAPHRCESCLIGFQFQENLEDHVKRKHTSGKDNTTACDVCLQYVDHGAKNMHIFWHLTRYECVACAERFTSYGKAAIHYRKIHHHSRSCVSFKCPYCSYKTGRKNWFTAHLNAHTKCKLCGTMLGCGTGIKPNIHRRHCAGAKFKPLSKVRKAKVTSTTGPILKNVHRMI